jgi:exosortase
MSSITQDGLTLQDQVPPRQPDVLADILHVLKDYVSSRTGQMVLLLIAAMAFCFSPIVRHLQEFWFGENSYFTHGVLVPFLCIYILYDRREKIRAAKVKPIYWAIIPMVPILYCCLVASRSDMMGPLSYACIILAFLTSLSVGGWEVTKAIWPALIFFAFALPFGQGYLDTVTVHFQGMSTDMAYELLKLFHVGPPMRINSTQIILGDYSLYVAAACSGLKLTLSVTAFVVLFMIVGHLRWWANLILVASILPVCILVNGIRIAMIGAVGCFWGDKAASTFHDWSGYLSIVICFFILMKLTRALGWK